MQGLQPYANPDYRPDIDGLRAVAVLSVVVFHAFPDLLKGGFIGVDVFFVISGYLISTIIFKNLESGEFSFTEFYSRRIKRIFPALVLVLVTCFVFGWFALFSDEYGQLGKHIAGGAAFISNFVLWNEAGYFDNSAEVKPLLHLWSLGIEEQFYLFWPLVLWLAWKRKSLIVPVIVSITALSFYFNIQYAAQNSTAAFYSPQSRLWELACGSLLAWMHLFGKVVGAQLFAKPGVWLKKAVGRKQSEGATGIFASCFSLLGLGLLGIGLWQITPESRFPGFWALTPVLGVLFIIGAGPGALVNRALSNRAVVWFGLISYPLYLWHWPLLSFARIVESETPSVGVRFAIVVLSIALASATYVFVEKPIRFGAWNNKKLITLVAVMVITGIAGYSAYLSDGLKFRSHISQMNAVNAQFVGPLWKYQKNDICQSKYPLDGVEKYRWWFCIASKDEDPTLLLIGNSYANQLYPGIINSPKLSHHSVLSIGACDAGWVEKDDLDSKETTSPCSGLRPLEHQEMINKIVTEKKSVRAVIIAGINRDPDTAYIERIRKRVQFFEDNNVKVILIAPLGRLAYDIKGCYARPFKAPAKTCKVAIQQHKDWIDNFDPLISSILITNPDVEIFDPNILFCDDNECVYKLSGMPGFRDKSGHLSEYASNRMIEHFVEWAELHVPEILSN